ncbi:discoidin domain-containing protein [bacterium]|nr:discoidin domain-containing protein [bacterium]
MILKRGYRRRTVTGGGGTPTYVGTDTTYNLVPAMASDTQGGWTVTESDKFGAGYEGWKLFDGTTGKWSVATGGDEWVTVQLPTPLVVGGITFQMDTTTDVNAWKVQGSNNGSTWDDLDTQTGQTTGYGTVRTYTFSNTTAYSYYRWYITGWAGAYIQGPTLKLHPAIVSGGEGWIDPDGQTIDNSTLAYANTYGFDGTFPQVASSSIYFEGPAYSQPWHYGLDFGAGNSRVITKAVLYGITTFGFSAVTATMTFTLQGSDNDSTWNDVANNTAAHSDKDVVVDASSNTTAYRYWRIKLTRSTGTNDSYFSELQFFGYEP